MSEGVWSSLEEVELAEVLGEYACTSGLSAKRTCLEPWPWLKLVDADAYVERVVVLVLGEEYRGLHAGLYACGASWGTCSKQTALATSRRPAAVPTKGQRGGTEEE